MSRSVSIYFGPYVMIKREALQRKSSVKGCSVCNEVKSGKYCDECGEKITRIKVSKNIDLEDVLETMGKQRNFMCDEDQPDEWHGKMEGYDSDTYTIGTFRGLHGVGDYRHVVDIKKMRSATTEQLEFITEFNTLYGEGSMVLHYGVVVDGA